MHPGATVTQWDGDSHDTASPRLCGMCGDIPSVTMNLLLSRQGSFYCSILDVPAEWFTTRLTRYALSTRSSSPIVPLVIS
jgi:hypothetical protein